MGRGAWAKNKEGGGAKNINILILPKVWGSSFLHKNKEPYIQRENKSDNRFVRCLRDISLAKKVQSWLLPGGGGGERVACGLEVL